MLDFRIEFPFWVYLLVLAAIFVYLALSGIGIYYLVSKKFEKITLILPALIILGLIIPKSLNPYHWVEVIKIYSEFISLILVSLNYFVLFAVINFLHRLISKPIS
jgi:hypothetical protein